MLKYQAGKHLEHQKEIEQAVVTIQKFVRAHQAYLRYQKEKKKRIQEIERKQNEQNDSDDNNDVEFKQIKLETFYGHLIEFQVPDFNETSELHNFIKDRFYELEGLIPQWQVIKPDEKDGNRFYLELAYNAPKGLTKDVSDQQRKLIRSLFDMKSHLTHLRKLDFLHKLNPLQQQKLTVFVDDYSKRKESSGYYDYYEEETFLDFAKKHGYDEALVPLAEEYVRID